MGDLAVRLQSSTSVFSNVQIGPVGLGVGVDPQNNKIGSSVSLSLGGLGASVSSKGDLCVGGSIGGGVGVAGRAGASACYNGLNGHISTKQSAGVGVGIGLQEVQLSGTVGVQNSQDWGSVGGLVNGIRKAIQH